VDRFTEWMVYLGAHDLIDTTEPGRVVIVSAKAIRHEGFSSSQIINDVGVVNLPKDVQLTGKSAFAMN